MRRGVAWLWYRRFRRLLCFKQVEMTKVDVWDRMPQLTKTQRRANTILPGRDLGFELET
jgi:hypothetical protein